jgi:hypothetical protein
LLRLDDKHRNEAELPIGVADLDYEFSLDLFEKSNLKLIFGYVQNHYSYLDSATPQ